MSSYFFSLIGCGVRSTVLDTTRKDWHWRGIWMFKVEEGKGEGEYIEHLPLWRLGMSYVGPHVYSKKKRKEVKRYWNKKGIIIWKQIRAARHWVYKDKTITQFISMSVAVFSSKMHYIALHCTVLVAVATKRLAERTNEGLFPSILRITWTINQQQMIQTSISTYSPPSSPSSSSSSYFQVVRSTNMSLAMATSTCYSIA